MSVRFKIDATTVCPCVLEGTTKYLVVQMEIKVGTHPFIWQLERPTGKVQLPFLITALAAVMSSGMIILGLLFQLSILYGKVTKTPING
jgi:hypothetical protein